MASAKNKSARNSGNITPIKKANKTGSRNDFYFFGTIIILVIVVVSFVLVPLLASLGGSVRRDQIVFGKYGNVPIVYSMTDSSNRLRRNFEYNLYRFNVDPASLPPSQAQLFMYMAFNDTVPFCAILDILEKSGFDITEGRIDREIAKALKMQGSSFDEYTQMPKDRKDSIIKDTKEYLLESAFKTDTWDNNFTNDKTYQFLENLATEKKAVEYVTFSFDNYPEEKVIEFGEKNKDLFSKVKLQRILVEKESDAKAILEKYNNREFTFEQLAMAQTIEEKNDEADGNVWELGEYYRYRIDKMFDEDTTAAISQVISGGLTEPIEIEGGWMIYKVDPIDSSFDIDTEEGILTVRLYMNENEVGVIEDFINKEAESFAKDAKASGFSEAALASSLTVNQTEAFPVSYGELNFIDSNLMKNQDLKGAGAFTSSDFYKEIFSLNTGDISNPIVMDGMIIVAKVQSTEEKTPIERTRLTSFIDSGIRDDFTDMTKESELFTDNFDAAFKKNFSRPEAEQQRETSEEGPSPSEE